MIVILLGPFEVGMGTFFLNGNNVRTFIRPINKKKNQLTLKEYFKKIT
jgi:hypothetical protein